MKKLLIPLDGSEFADGVLDHVGLVLGREPGEVVLLYVVLDPTRRSASGRLPSQSERLRRVEDPAAVREHLAQVKARLEQAGATVTLVERTGDPAAEILAAIEEQRPDLVAMSTHARSAFLSWLRGGSVAEGVMRRSVAPVLLVTPRGMQAERPHGALKRVLVPLDGSESAARVLPAVEDLARHHGAEVVLGRVAWEGLSRPLLAATLQLDRVAETLAPWAERLRQAGISARCVGSHGDSANEILDMAEREDVDLIAMTSHGRTGLLRLIDGSVTEKVLHRCTRPMLVLHT